MDDFLLFAVLVLIAYSVARPTNVSAPSVYINPGPGRANNTTSSFLGGWGVLDPNSLDTMTRTIAGEASNQSTEAQEGVANVIINRVKNGISFSSSVVGVCQQPHQFQCWSGGADTERILAMTTDDPQYQTAYAIAEDALTGELSDNTDGAVFYFSPPVTRPPSSWGAVAFTVQLDSLRFYRQA
ncbi:MAG TPA: cell wall hydrolase [Rhizomicrobium sp.]|nr:cell wall hydrolase [Rhizomicrobium sp.]